MAVPAALAFVGIAVTAIWFFDRQAKIRWAREEVLPEMARMIEGNDVMRNLVPPYRLAVKAEKVLGNDPKLAELFSKCSLNINVRTDPPGARVSVKEYTTPEAKWSYLGTIPLENVRVPVGVFRWKFEKDDYETVIAASSTWDVDTHDPISSSLTISSGHSTRRAASRRVWSGCRACKRDGGNWLCPGLSRPFRHLATGSISTRVCISW